MHKHNNKNIFRDFTDSLQDVQKVWSNLLIFVMGTDEMLGYTAFLPISLLLYVNAFNIRGRPVENTIQVSYFQRRWQPVKLLTLIGRNFRRSDPFLSVVTNCLRHCKHKQSILLTINFI